MLKGIASSVQTSNGTVQSVGLNLPVTQFTVANSPVTGNGTINVTLNSPTGSGGIALQSNANLIAPNIGAATGASVSVTGGVTGNTITGNVSVTIGTGAALLGMIPLDNTSNQTISSNTTLQNATGFSFNIAANERWNMQAQLLMGDGLNTTGVKIAMTVPAGANMTLGIGAIPIVPAAATGMVRDTQTSGTAIDFTASPLNMNAVTKAVFGVFAQVQNGANAGTVALQFAQSTSDPTATILKWGSSGLAVRKA